MSIFCTPNPTYVQVSSLNRPIIRLFPPQFLHVQTLLRDGYYGRSHNSLAVVFGLRGQEHTRPYTSMYKSTGVYTSMDRPTARLWPRVRPLDLPELRVKVMSFLKLAGKGADKNKANNNGYTALMRGSAGNHVEAVRLLLDTGADINIVTIDLGLSALHFAALNNSVDVARLLVEASDELVVRRSAKGTALDLALTNRNTEMIRLLLISSLAYVGFRAPAHESD